MSDTVLSTFAEPHRSHGLSWWGTYLVLDSLSPTQNCTLHAVCQPCHIQEHPGSNLSNLLGQPWTSLSSGSRVCPLWAALTTPEGGSRFQGQPDAGRAGEAGCPVKLRSCPRVMIKYARGCFCEAWGVQECSQCGQCDRTICNWSQNAKYPAGPSASLTIKCVKDKHNPITKQRTHGNSSVAHGMKK